MLWALALAASCAVMLIGRDRLDKAHVALVFLLVVLGGSAKGGRDIGLSLAGVAFLLFNWFFVPPYGALTVTNPLDWLVLGSFLILAEGWSSRLFEKVCRAVVGLMVLISGTLLAWDVAVTGHNPLKKRNQGSEEASLENTGQSPATPPEESPPKSKDC